MSSHIFEEIEDICDRAAIIHEGRVMDPVDLKKQMDTDLSTNEFEQVLSVMETSNISLDTYVREFPYQFFCLF